MLFFLFCHKWNYQAKKTMKPYFFIIVFFGFFYLIMIILGISTVGKNLQPITRGKITLRINLVIFLSGCLMLAAATLFDVNYLSYKSPMPYSKWREITLADFKGLKRPDQTLDGQSDFAFIVSDVKVKRSDGIIAVTSYFHPARSYVFNDKLQNNDLLIHELYHFHITEYCARLLRKSIILSGKPISDKTLESMKNKIKHYADSLQYEYDDQTYHSYVVGKQKNWERVIDSCLNSLKGYESVIITNQ
jgi:hypothetical protein